MSGKRRKKGKTSNAVLLALGLFGAVFIAVMVVTFWVKGCVPDTLIQYTLGAGGVEAFLLAGIKISKIYESPREPSGAGRVRRGVRERTEFSPEGETELSGLYDDEGQVEEKFGESEDSYE